MQIKTQVMDFQDSKFELGRKQWTILEDIERRYKTADVSCFLHNTSIFDNEWCFKDRYTIKFNEYLPTPEQKPLRLLLQVATYEMIHTLHLSASTAYGYLLNFLGEYIPMLIERGILLAHHNAPFASFSSIEDHEITHTVQLALAKRKIIPIGALTFIGKLSALPQQEFKTLIGKLPTPWHGDGVSILKWCEQQRNIAGIETERKFHPPLPFETVSTIVKHSLPIIGSHDALEGFTAAIRKARDTNKSIDPSKALASAKECAPVRDYVLTQRDIFDQIIPIKINTRETRKNGRGYPQLYLDVSWTNHTLRLAQSACAWIILLTTGLRNVDMRNLRVGCCQPSKKHKDIYWFVSDVKKTKNRIVLPVGKTTYQAVKLLERLRYNDNPFLLTELKKPNTFKLPVSKRKLTKDELGKMRESTSLNKLLKFLPDYYDFELNTILDEEATAHCVRATLAGYIAEHSHVAILLLKRMFGHTNALMPDEYIRRNPLVIKKREEMLKKTHGAMARDLAKAIVNREVGGSYGTTLEKGAEALKDDINEEFKLKNENLTEMDLLQTMEERLTNVLLDDIEGGETYALITPLSVVCMRPTNDGTDSPCAAHLNHAKRQDSKISKAITDALMTLPNPSQCVGISCPTALLVKKWSRKLLETFDFYVNYRAGINADFNVEEEAKTFVKMYAEPLKKIYSEERNEGYFDVQTN